MFSLLKVSYIVCDKYERQIYNDLETLPVDIKACCLGVRCYIRYDCLSDEDLTGIVFSPKQ